MDEYMVRPRVHLTSVVHLYKKIQKTTCTHRKFPENSALPAGRLAILSFGVLQIVNTRFFSVFQVFDRIHSQFSPLGCSEMDGVHPRHHLRSSRERGLPTLSRIPIRRPILLSSMLHASCASHAFLPGWLGGSSGDVGSAAFSLSLVMPHCYGLS